MGRSGVAVEPALRLGGQDPRLASPVICEARRVRKAVPPAPRTRAGDGGPGGPGGPGATGDRSSLPAPPHCASLARHGAEARGGEFGAGSVARARAAARAGVRARKGTLRLPLAAGTSRAHSRRGFSEARCKPLRLDPGCFKSPSTIPTQRPVNAGTWDLGWGQ